MNLIRTPFPPYSHTIPHLIRTPTFPTLSAHPSHLIRTPTFPTLFAQSPSPPTARRDHPPQPASVSAQFRPDFRRRDRVREVNREEASASSAGVTPMRTEVSWRRWSLGPRPASIGEAADVYGPNGVGVGGFIIGSLFISFTYVFIFIYLRIYVFIL